MQRSAWRAVGLIFVSASVCAWLISGPTARASEPDNPYGCYVADEPPPDGPNAPTALVGEWSPAYIGGILLDAFDELDWVDNSSDETCFVVEVVSGGDFHVVGYSSPNYAMWTRISGHGVRTYRVYAANAVARSAYSNLAVIDTGPVPTPRVDLPSPSPSPHVSATPTLEPTATPTQSPAASVTPASLPTAGGRPSSGPNSVATEAVALLLGSVALAFAWRLVRLE